MSQQSPFISLRNYRTALLVDRAYRIKIISDLPTAEVLVQVEHYSKFLVDTTAATIPPPQAIPHYRDVKVINMRDDDGQARTIDLRLYRMVLLIDYAGYTRPHTKMDVLDTLEELERLRAYLVEVTQKPEPRLRPSVHYQEVVHSYLGDRR
jgi:hypothetical protein